MPTKNKPEATNLDDEQAFKAIAELVKSRFPEHIIIVKSNNSLQSCIRMPCSEANFALDTVKIHVLNQRISSNDTK